MKILIISLIAITLAQSQSWANTESKLELCSGRADWFVKITKPLNKPELILTNYKLSARSRPGGDEYYVVYQDSEKVTQSYDGVIRTYSGKRFRLVIDEQSSLTSNAATLFRWNERLNEWTKHPYYCNNMPK